MASPALWDVRYGSRADLAATPAQTCAIILSVALSATCKCLLLARRGRQMPIGLSGPNDPRGKV